MKNAFFPKHKQAENLVIGFLELPPKNKRKNLKYRVIRLKPDAEPSLYFNSDIKPLRNYIWEEELASYLEYKNWDYSEETGCYSYNFFPVL